MKNSPIQLMFSLFFVILLSNLVFAFQDFDAFGDANIGALQCTVQKASIVLSNIGDEPVGLAISAAGNSAEWVLFSTDVVYLEVNDEKEIFFDVNVPCDAKIGSNKLRVLIDSSDAQKFADFSLNVEKPVNLDLLPNIFFQSIAPCSPARFNITVVNTGGFSDNYKFSLKPFAEADISPVEALLSAGQKQDVAVSFVPDDCSFYGDVPLVFSAKAEKTGVSADIDLSLSISPADILEIGRGIDAIISNHSISTAKIFVKNLGEQNASYDLKVEGPEWVGLGSENIDVAGSSDAGFALILKPVSSVDNGEYPVVISAFSKISDRVYSKSIVVKITEKSLFSNLFSKLFSKIPSISFLKSFDLKYLIYSFAGLILLVILFVFVKKIFAKVSSKSEHEEMSENDSDGSEEDYYAAEIKGSDDSKFDSKADSKLRKVVEKELRSKFTFVPKSSVVSPLRSSKFFGKFLLVITLACLGFAGFFFKNFIVIYLDYFVLGIFILIFCLLFKKIFNKFRVSKKFRFLIEKDSGLIVTGWRKGLFKFDFVVDESVENLKLSIKKGLRGFIFPDGKVLYSCRIISNCPDNLFNKVTVYFKVRRSLFSSEKDLRVVNFVTNRWKKLDFEITGSDNKFVYLESIADSIGAFAVVCKQNFIHPVVEKVVNQVVEPVEEKVEEKVADKKSAKKQKSHSKFNFKIIGYFVLFVLLVLVGGAFVYLSNIQPVAPTVVNGIQPQIFDQDSQHTLDVSQFFKDPDNDTLSFKASPVENINIDFNEGIATFTPDVGWSGKRSTVFTADDGMNGTISSNSVDIVVRKSLLPAYLQPYLLQIVGGVLFIIVVTILLVFRDNIIKFLDDGEED